LPTRIKDGVKDAPPGPNVLGHLKGYVERIERLDEEKSGIADDIKSVYAEAKGAGLHVKALRMLVSKRKKDQEEQAELEALLALYEGAMRE
jgi:uncharacterized protein (UPF0335 family)